MFVPRREEIVLQPVKPRKKKKVFIDIDIPKGVPVHIPPPRHIDVVRHVEPKQPRRRNSLHLPLTAGFELPWDAEYRHPRDHVVKEHGRRHRPHYRDMPQEPRHHIRLPIRRAKPAAPAPPMCALRCGNARMKGSHYCENDSCRDPSCDRQSTVWAGYCHEHGCGVRDCRRRRQVTKIAADNFIVSAYCGLHSCRTWVCSHVGKSQLDGFCNGHYRRCRGG